MLVSVQVESQLTNRRCAFTLVELLVVISIIGVLMSLLLPAVQNVREAGRRVSCSNNLYQLGRAIQHYASAHEVLPASGIVAPPLNKVYESRSGRMFSWLVLILPQLEQQSLYAQFNFEVSVLQQPKEPQAVHLPLLCCPSDSAPGKFFVDAQLTSGKRFAKGNYAAFVSPYHTDLQLLYPGALVSTGQRLESILDGKSYTLMLSEVRARNHEQDQRGAWALPWTGASLLAFDMHADGFSTPDRFVGSHFSVGLTQPPNNLGPNKDMLYACPDMAGAQLEGMPCEVWQSSGPENFLSVAPRSFHPGGVYVAFVDGHVGFLANTVDDYAMAHMISINDRQTIKIDDYVR